jgi:hypothetical protein
MTRLRLTLIPRLVAPFLIAAACIAGMATPACGDDAALDPAPFGAEFPNLDGWATGAWWTKRAKQQPFSLDVPRDERIAFAVYTVTGPAVNGGAGNPADATLCRRNSRSMPIQPARVMVAGPRSSSRRFFGNGAIGLSSA